MSPRKRREGRVAPIWEFGMDPLVEDGTEVRRAMIAVGTSRCFFFPP